MRHFYVVLIGVGALILLAPLTALAMLDTVEIGMHDVYKQSLRWDNIASAPHVVAGKSPSLLFKHGVKGVALKPGDFITVRVEGGEQLRVTSRGDAPLVGADLQLEYSLTSVLYQQLPLLHTSSNHDLLSAIQASKPYLVRISRPKHFQKALAVALFVSRRMARQELASYRNLVALPVDTVAMRRADEAAAQTYWTLLPHQIVELRVTGPARYALENRYAYPAHEQGLVQPYRIYSRIDDHTPVMTMEFESSAESAFPVYVDGRKRVMGRREVGYLEIPEGEHLLRLDSTAPLMARLLQQQEDYLLPHLNQPKRTALAVRQGIKQAHYQLRIEPHLVVVRQPRLSINWLQDGWKQLENHQFEKALKLWQAGVNQLPDKQLVGSLGLYPKLQQAISGLKRAGVEAKVLIIHERRGFHLLTVQAIDRDLKRRQLKLAALKRAIGMRELLWANEAKKFKSIHSASATNDQQAAMSSQVTMLATMNAKTVINLDQGEAMARRLVRDNSRREGGMLGTVLIEAMNRPVQPQLQRLAEELRGYHTFYRDLLPQEKRTGKDQYFAHFIAKSLYRTGENGRGISFASQHLQALLSRIPAAFFNAIPNRSIVSGDKEDGLVYSVYQRYLLPPRTQPSLLRLIVDQSNQLDAAFFLQFDHDEPIRLRNINEQLLPNKSFAPSQGEAALKLSEEVFGKLSASTSSNAFAARHTPGKLIRAGVLEIPLASDVREVRVWRSGGKVSKDLYCALQYRTSQPFALSESEFDEMASRTTSDRLALFKRTLRRGRASEVDVSEQALSNHWLPLVRALRSAHKQLIAQVAPLKMVAKGLLFTNAEASRLSALVEAAEQQGQWLLALEKWGALVRRAPPPIRQQAMLAQSGAMVKIGENYLAEQQLRSLVFYGAKPRIRQQAIEALEQIYRASGALGRLVSLWSAVSVQTVSIAHLRRLAEVMEESGDHQQALAIGLLLPVGLMPRQAMLRAAYQLSFWKVYQRLLASLPSAQERALWQGLEAMSEGQWSEAHHYFNAAAELGKPWLAAITQGQSLNRRFEQKKTIDQGDLQVWHSEHPGPFMWREDGSLVKDYAGSATLYSIDKDAYSRAYVATADKPVRLRLMGPLHLRIDVRPLHNRAQSQTLDGWLQLREAGGMRLLPISGNDKATGLTIIGEQDRWAGHKVSGEFYFGPGVHELSLDGGSLSLLLRLFVRTPEMSIPLLPALRVENLPLLTNQQNAQSSRDDLLATEESWKRWPEAAMLKNGDIVGALALHPGKDSFDALRRMTLLLWWSDQQPTMHQKAMLEAELLGSRFPDHKELQSIGARLTRSAQWQLVSSGIQKSAGVRYLTLSGWQPESQALRVRKALMAGLADSGQMLSGTGRLVYSMRHLKPQQVRLKLAHVNLPMLASLPLHASYQLDQQPPVSLLLSAEQPSLSRSLHIPAGEHLLRVKIDATVSNQFMQVELTEPRSSTSVAIIERPWHVATAREPLELAIAGPTWLRIDRWHKGGVVSSYQLVAKPFERLKFTPLKGQSEALLRVHQRALISKKGGLLSRTVRVDPTPVLAPYMKIESNRAADTYLLHDGFRLGGQEKGTLSYAASLHRRRDPQAVGANANESFLQLSLTHRYFDEDKRRYYRSTMLGRERQHGGETLGLKESIRYQSIGSTLNFHLDGSLYLQNPAGSFLNSGYQWAGLIKGGVSQKREIDPKRYHLPQLSLFKRAMSMHGFANYQPTMVDQDIFSRYKWTYRQGLILADTVYQRPWMDTLWYGGGKLVSSKRLNPIKPEHFSLKAGWKQLFGSIQVDGSYQLLHYFASDQRLRARSQRTLVLNSRWDYWNRYQNRFEIDFNIRHDSDTGNITGLLSFIMHESNGRGFRDFQPSEVEFGALRKRDIPSIPNNSVIEVVQ
ncbi:MAG: hypothetical protein Q9M31_07710 [Mariprofundus sp.]|nr:hypothetical protein [Mariprofundus sp.]